MSGPIQPTRFQPGRNCVVTVSAAGVCADAPPCVEASPAASATTATAAISPPRRAVSRIGSLPGASRRDPSLRPAPVPVGGAGASVIPGATVGGEEVGTGSATPHAGAFAMAAGRAAYVLANQATKSATSTSSRRTMPVATQPVRFTVREFAMKCWPAQYTLRRLNSSSDR